MAIKVPKEAEEAKRKFTPLSGGVIKLLLENREDFPLPSPITPPIYWMRSTVQPKI